MKYNKVIKKKTKKPYTKRHTKRTQRNTKRIQRNKKNNQKINSKNYTQKGGNLSITIQINYSNINNVPNNANITPQVKELLSQQIGNHIPPSIQLQNASPETLYLITMTDRDAPPGIYTHWIATIQNNNILDTITKYNHPTPPQGSGTHKYITNVYKIDNQQKEKILNELQSQIKNNPKLSRVAITTQLNNIINANKLTSLATHQFLVNP